MKVILNPIKEIRITQIVKMDVQRITKLQAVKNEKLGWCGGFLFSFDVFQTDYLIKKQADGILYLDTLVYAESEKIENSKWNGYSIEVIDFSGYDTIEKLIESIIRNNV